MYNFCEQFENNCVLYYKNVKKKKKNLCVMHILISN